MIRFRFLCKFCTFEEVMGSTYFDSKPRYMILDGLRGVAAMLVVAYHLFETYATGAEDQIVNHGYLAVDFFFALSGFVIGYAYDDRWDSMTAWQFFKRRLIRLHPMVIFASFIGLMLFYLGDSPAFPAIGQAEWYKPVILFLLACLMIPVGAGLDARGWLETYPLNGPQWTLMLEYIANILYALFIRKLSKTVLAILVVIFSSLTIMLCMNVDPFGVTADFWAPYTAVGGWSLNAEQLWIATCRLFYPFLCGLLISRRGKFINVKGGFWVCALIIASCLLMPRVGGTSPDRFWMNGIYETVCILAVFPLTIIIGAGSRITGKRSAAVCKWLGAISYPLYIIHYPFVYIQMAWKETHLENPASQHIMVSAGCYIIALMMAYGALKLYDEPIREWLKSSRKTDRFA